MSEAHTIKNAFIDAEKMRISAYPSDIEIGWVPSERFERKMNSLIKVQRRFYWKYFNTVGKRAAVILTVLVLLFCSAMSVRAIREPVIKFIVETYEKFTGIFYQNKNTGLDLPETIETEYTLSEVPEGYSLVKSTCQTFTVNTFWSNDAGEDIQLSQHTVVNSTFMIDAKNTTYQNVFVGDYEAIYYEKHKNRTLIWNNEEYVFILICPTSLPYERMLSAAEGLVPK